VNVRRAFQLAREEQNSSSKSPSSNSWRNRATIFIRGIDASLGHLIPKRPCYIKPTAVAGCGGFDRAEDIGFNDESDSDD